MAGTNDGEKLLERKISRRSFCKLCLSGSLSLFSLPLLPELFRTVASAESTAGRKGFIIKKEAMFYEKLNQKTIRCLLCPRYCVLPDRTRGFCRAREPWEGKHYSLVYANPTAVHIDPMEKKPLFHFLPATSVFSIATAGCNFRCKYCQNWQISQFAPEDTVNSHLPPRN